MKCTLCCEITYNALLHRLFRATSGTPFVEALYRTEWTKYHGDGTRLGWDRGWDGNMCVDPRLAAGESNLIENGWGHKLGGCVN